MSKRTRCAIYTRKSSDEGLSQSFNSLHAQREAGEAYVRSQASEGWRCLPGRYDDGAYSGAHMDRPALRMLLADVADGLVDVVVVYKVDRLTRSLSDFARIIELLEQRNVAFVSVTQPFNTTSSMGRLTLNVLLSFAQFEREVTGERIRDKIRASKAKGMWMGGMPPLGYDPGGQSRTLVVNADEARTVRSLFNTYLELQNLAALQTWSRDEGLHSKRWLTKEGRKMGGFPFNRSGLLHLLQNRAYLGETVHKGEVFPGLHKAIVDRATFDAVQAIIADPSRYRRRLSASSSYGMLSGLLFDTNLEPMPLQLTSARGKRYRHYGVLHTPAAQANDGESVIRRVRADDIEALAVEWTQRLTDADEASVDRAAVRKLIQRIEIHASTVRLVLRAEALPTSPAGRFALLRTRLDPSQQLVRDPADSRVLIIDLPIRFVTRGGRAWIRPPTLGAEEKTAGRSGKLVERLRKAHRLLRAHRIDPEAIAP
ncbi:recombinase family protein, partial [Bosea sp. (in: a-proteobacteria)]|uniref:recombinase family protein n=1 Tax=Bosea sp. (in: a-proteobacteria) TaxID=1871050 RepID=UPI0012229ED0